MSMNKEYSIKRSYYLSSAAVKSNNECQFKPSTSEFILRYKPNLPVGHQSHLTCVEPTVEGIRNLLEIIRSKEDKYQSLLETFDVFNMLDPTTSLKAYTDESNINEIKSLYDRYIKLMPDKKTIQIDPTFIDYLRKISSYLSDGLKKQRTDQFQVECLRKPVIVLACDEQFFDILQGAIRTLDTYWPDHKIVFYDLGITDEQETLLRNKCARCKIIKFPFAAIEQVAMHVGTLRHYVFKPFVIQDALRRYGTIIYGDSSIRLTTNSFNPVLIDNYIRGFAARELPGHSLSCSTRSGTFNWFNQSYTQYDNTYMTASNFLVVTDTFLTRLIMKAWLTCALEIDCLLAFGTPIKCNGLVSGSHRYDQSVISIILTHFFFRANKSTRSHQKLIGPASYDMLASITNLDEIEHIFREEKY